MKLLYTLEHTLILHLNHQSVLLYPQIVSSLIVSKTVLLCSQSVCLQVTTHLGYGPGQDDVSAEGTLGVIPVLPAEVGLGQRHGQRGIWTLLQGGNKDPLVKDCLCRGSQFHKSRTHCPPA